MLGRKKRRGTKAPHPFYEDEYFITIMFIRKLIIYNVAVSKPQPLKEACFTLNGCNKKHLASQTIEELLVEIGVVGPGVAVERNCQVVRQIDYSQTIIEEGDNIEVVRLVGGG